MKDTIIPDSTNSAGEIAFGFDRETDERSLGIFIGRFADRSLLETLVPRMDDDDIYALVDLCSGLMKKHLSEKEYHSLFMAEK